MISSLGAGDHATGTVPTRKGMEYHRHVARGEDAVAFGDESEHYAADPQSQANDVRH